MNIQRDDRGRCAMATRAEVALIRNSSVGRISRHGNGGDRSISAGCPFCGALQDANMDVQVIAAASPVAQTRRRR